MGCSYNSGFKMRRPLWLLVPMVFWIFPTGPSWALDQPSLPALNLSSRDRILILAPHPDDEVLGCGGVIQKAVELKLPLRVVFLTYGDNNEMSFFLYRKHPVFIPKAVQRMGEIRHGEALAAGQILGLSPDQLTFLGFPDWGTFPIWCSHWGDQPPYRSMLTRVTAVPYQDAFRSGAAYKGEEILGDLETILREFHPTKVFVSHPADVHPDHLAWYLFTRVALWDLEPEIHPELYPYLVHYHHWPKPGKKSLANILDPPDSLEEVAWNVFPLTPEQVSRKEEAFKAHRSQYQSSFHSLFWLLRSNELFGDVPDVRLGNGGFSRESPGASSELKKAPEGFTEEERAAFVGLEWQSVRLERDHIIMSINLSKPLAKGVAASIYLFGYRSDQPFSRMPKLHVRVGTFHWTVSDQTRKLDTRRIRLQHGFHRITLSIPTGLLREPEKLLVSAHTSLEGFPLDWVSWRILEL